MKVQELLANMHRNNFDMVKELQVKTYLPIEEKKLISRGIIYECTNEEDGVIKLDSVQQYMSYVKYMITRHTNLEYTDADYDVLCSTGNEQNVLSDILDCFGPDAQECSRILNLMLDDYMRENSIEVSVSKFLNNLVEKMNMVVNKIENNDIKSMIPDSIDLDKLAKFLNNK